MSEGKKTKRTPISEPMLIRHGKEWQACYQARGTINYERVTAWVYGADSTFFCRVGEQNEIIMLPQKDMYFRGPFAYLVDRVNPDGVPIEILGGATSCRGCNRDIQIPEAALLVRLAIDERRSADERAV